jgi:hypothetical protein
MGTMLPDLTLPDEVPVRGRGKGRAIHGAALPLSQLVTLLAMALGHKTIVADNVLSKRCILVYLAQKCTLYMCTSCTAYLEW